MSEDRLAFSYCQSFGEQLFAIPFLSLSFVSTRREKNELTTVEDGKPPTEVEQQEADARKNLESKSNVFFSSLLKAFSTYVIKDFSLSCSSYALSTNNESSVSPSFFHSFPRGGGSKVYSSRLRQCMLQASHIVQQEAITLYRGLRMMSLGKGKASGQKGKMNVGSRVTTTASAAGRSNGASHRISFSSSSFGPHYASPAGAAEAGVGRVQEGHEVHPFSSSLGIVPGGGSPSPISPSCPTAFPSGDLQQDALWCVCVAVGYYFPSYWDFLKDRFCLLSRRHPTIRCIRSCNEDEGPLITENALPSFSHASSPNFPCSSPFPLESRARRGAVFIYLPFQHAEWGIHQPHVVASLASSSSFSLLSSTLTMRSIAPPSCYTETLSNLSSDEKRDDGGRDGVGEVRNDSKRRRGETPSTCMTITGVTANITTPRINTTTSNTSSCADPLTRHPLTCRSTGSTATRDTWKLTEPKDGPPMPRGTKSSVMKSTGSFSSFSSSHSTEEKEEEQEGRKGKKLDHSLQKGEEKWVGESTSSSCTSSGASRPIGRPLPSLQDLQIIFSNRAVALVLSAAVVYAVMTESERERYATLCSPPPLPSGPTRSGMNRQGVRNIAGGVFGVELSSSTAPGARLQRLVSGDVSALQTVRQLAEKRQRIQEYANSFISYSFLAEGEGGGGGGRGRGRGEQQRQRMEEIEETVVNSSSEEHPPLGCPPLALPAGSPVDAEHLSTIKERKDERSEMTTSSSAPFSESDGATAVNTPTQKLRDHEENNNAMPITANKLSTTVTNKEDEEVEEGERVVDRLGKKKREATKGDGCQASADHTNLSVERERVQPSSVVGIVISQNSPPAGTGDMDHHHHLPSLRHSHYAAGSTGNDSSLLPTPGVTSSSEDSSSSSPPIVFPSSFRSFSAILYEGKNTGSELDSIGGREVEDEDEDNGLALAAGMLVTASRIRQEKLRALLISPSFFFPPLRSRLPAHFFVQNLARSSPSLLLRSEEFSSLLPLQRREEEEALLAALLQDHRGSGKKKEEDIENNCASGVGVCGCTPQSSYPHLKDDEVETQQCYFFDPQRSILSGWTPQEPIFSQGNSVGGGGGGEMALSFAENGIFCPLPPGLLTGHYLYTRLIISSLWVLLYSCVLIPWWMACRKGYEETNKVSLRAVSPSSSSAAAENVAGAGVSKEKENKEEKGEEEEEEAILDRHTPILTALNTTSSKDQLLSGSFFTAGEHCRGEACITPDLRMIAYVQSLVPVFRVCALWERVCSPLVVVRAVEIVQHASQFLKDYGCPVCDEKIYGSKGGGRELMVVLPAAPPSSSSTSSVHRHSRSTNTVHPPSNTRTRTTPKDDLYSTEYDYTQRKRSFALTSLGRWSSLQQAQRIFEAALQSYLRTVDVAEHPLLPGPFDHCGGGAMRTKKDTKRCRHSPSLQTRRFSRGERCTEDVYSSSPVSPLGEGENGPQGADNKTKKYWKKTRLEAKEEESSPSSPSSSILSLIASRLFIFGFFGDMMSGSDSGTCIGVPLPFPSSSPSSSTSTTTNTTTTSATNANPTNSMNESSFSEHHSTSRTIPPLPLLPMLPSLQKQLVELCGWWEDLKGILKEERRMHPSVPITTTMMTRNTHSSSSSTSKEDTTKASCKGTLRNIEMHSNVNGAGKKGAKNGGAQEKEGSKHQGATTKGPPSRHISSTAATSFISSSKSSWENGKKCAPLESCTYWLKLLCALETKGGTRMANISQKFSICLSRRLQGLLWCLVDSYSFYQTNISFISSCDLSRNTHDNHNNHNHHNNVPVPHEKKGDGPAPSKEGKEAPPLVSIQDLLLFLPFLWSALQDLPLTLLLQEVLFDGLPLPCCALWLVTCATGARLPYFLSPLFRKTSPTLCSRCSFPRKGKASCRVKMEKEKMPRQRKKKSGGEDKEESGSGRRGPLCEAAPRILHQWLTSIPEIDFLAEQQEMLQEQLDASFVLRHLSSTPNTTSLRGGGGVRAKAPPVPFRLSSTASSSSSTTSSATWLPSSLPTLPLSSYPLIASRCSTCYPFLTPDDGWVECAGCYAVFHQACVIPCQRDFSRFTFPIASASNHGRRTSLYEMQRRRGGELLLSPPPKQKGKIQRREKVQGGRESRAIPEKEVAALHPPATEVRHRDHPHGVEHTLTANRSFSSSDEKRTATDPLHENVDDDSDEEEADMTRNSEAEYFTTSFFLCHTCRLMEECVEREREEDANTFTSPRRNSFLMQEEEEAHALCSSPRSASLDGGWGDVGKKEEEEEEARVRHPVVAGHQIMLFRVEENE